jgi:hypothetical protein
VGDPGSRSSTMVIFSNLFKIQYLPSLFTDEAELLRVDLQDRLSGRRKNKVKIFDTKREKK